MKDLSATIEARLATLPVKPGVYIFQDDKAKTIYVGKAINLRSRVRSYFQKGSSDTRLLFSKIVEHTADIEVIVCSNELEALLLENNLIKKHRPTYNLRLRDDKTYLSLRVTTGEKWPRVHPIRSWRDDKHTYFGPYSSSRSVYELLRMIKKFIPLRTCSNAFFDSRKRPCIEYEIGRCTAPCVGLDSEESYSEMVREVLLLLRGKDKKLLAILKERMAKASVDQEYEKAALYRDQIAAIDKIMEQQNVHEHPHGDCDVLNFHQKGPFTSIHVLLVRHGRVISSATHTTRTHDDSPEKILAAFLGQYYHGEKYVPAEIILPHEPEDQELIEKWLGSHAGHRVVIKVPQRGPRMKLLAMARENAEVQAAANTHRIEKQETISQTLAEKLGCNESIRTIECYDISNIQGTLNVASKVSFEDGEPDTDLYRRYRIRSVKGSDDFASMEEVLRRRFKKTDDRDPCPDLVVVDGGKGQISSALKVLEELEVPSLLCGLAKDRLRGGSHTTERVYLPGQSDPIDLEEDEPASLLLQRIRDEAHRFANSYHRELRRRSQLVTGLEDVPGIGAKRRRALLQEFGSVKEVGKASPEELSRVQGMTPALAQSLHQFLNSPEEPDVEEEALEASIDSQEADSATESGEPPVDS
ncbi:MAG: excinuclease ABC subunit UvrC [Planctomycetota bacterium]